MTKTRCYRQYIVLFFYLFLSIPIVVKADNIRCSNCYHAYLHYDQNNYACPACNYQLDLHTQLEQLKQQLQIKAGRQIQSAIPSEEKYRNSFTHPNQVLTNEKRQANISAIKAAIKEIRQTRHSNIRALKQHCKALEVHHGKEIGSTALSLLEAAVCTIEENAYYDHIVAAKEIFSPSHCNISQLITITSFYQGKAESQITTSAELEQLFSAFVAYALSTIYPNIYAYYQPFLSHSGVAMKAFESQVPAFQNIQNNPRPPYPDIYSVYTNTERPADPDLIRIIHHPNGLCSVFFSSGYILENITISQMTALLARFRLDDEAAVWNTLKGFGTVVVAGIAAYYIIKTVVHHYHSDKI